MTFTLTPFISLFIGGLVAALVAVGFMLAQKKVTGSPAIAASLGAGFAAYTAVTIYQTGVLPVFENHTTNLWGVQVWWDLLFAVGVALFFILPRARKQGMHVPLWTLFVLLTASIGLLAMIARLFWLESGEAVEKAEDAKPVAKPAAKPAAKAEAASDAATDAAS